MAKFVALYERPGDVEAFDQHYRTVHLRIVERWPRVQSWTVTRLTGTPRGGDPPYHLMFEAQFASDEDLEQCLASDEMREAGRDIAEATRRFGVKATMLLGTEF